MAFQTAVFADQTFGFVGEPFRDGPTRARAKLLSSAANGGVAANNIIGHALTYVPGEQVFVVGDPNIAGTPNFYAGILSGPKQYASQGDGSLGGELAPTLLLPDGYVVEAKYMGSVIVYLVNGGTQGDVLSFESVTGQIYSGDKATNDVTFGPLVFGDIPNAIVMDVDAITAGNLAAIEMTAHS